MDFNLFICNLSVMAFFVKVSLKKIVAHNYSYTTQLPTLQKYLEGTKPESNAQ